MATETIKIPDLGGGDGVEVIEVCVAVGDQVEVEDSLLVLESDKASMEVPAPKAGKVVSISLKVGDSVGEGDVILELDVEGDAPADEPVAAEPEAADEEPAPPAADEAEAAPTASAGPETVKVPDIGGGDGVEVIELCVAAGDEVEEGDSLIVLESDKASMEVPAPFSGKVLSMLIKVGDAAAEGTAIAEMQRSGSSAPDTAVESPAAAETEQVKTPEPPEPEAATPAPAAPESSANEGNGKTVYAGPAVRKLAREFGISLDQVTGSGPRGRVVKEDLHAYVKTLTSAKPAAAAGGAGIPAIPEVDFSQFGEIEVEPLTKLHKLTAANMHRSWLNLPHVTQFDDADITELEAFRNSMKAEAQAKGVKLTPLPFLLKAAAVALRMNPKFNASLSAEKRRKQKD